MYTSLFSRLQQMGLFLGGGGGGGGGGYFKFVISNMYTSNMLCKTLIPIYFAHLIKQRT